MCCPDKPSLRERLFARFMAAEDENSHAQYCKLKAELFAGFSGRVLELGPGTGVNFPFFPKAIEWVGVEPNRAMHPFLEAKAKAAEIDVSYADGLSPEFGIESDSFDFAVSTLVLCSVPSVSEVLGHILRALKPGGSFAFIEHVVDQSNFFRRGVQTFVPFTPWRYFSDGCFPGRDIGGEIDQAGFSSIDCQSYHQEGAGFIHWINKPHIRGVAVK